MITVTIVLGILYSTLLWAIIVIANGLHKVRVDATNADARTNGTLAFFRTEFATLKRLREEDSASLESHESRLSNHDRAAGGFWLTAKKELLRIRDMSTGHLRNAVENGYAQGETCDKMTAEINRREEDARWRKADKIPTMDDFTAKLSLSIQLTDLRKVRDLIGTVRTKEANEGLARRVTLAVDNIERAMRGEPVRTNWSLIPEVDGKVKRANARGAELDQRFRKAAKVLQRSKKAVDMRAALGLRKAAKGKKGAA